MKKAVISGRNLSLGYQKGDRKKEVLHGLNFDLYPGQLTCLLGSNGVGKTTLVKAIMGRIPVWNGKLLVEGKELSTLNSKELSKLLAVVLTEPIVAGNMTVGQLVSLGRTPYLNWSGYLSAHDKKVVEEALISTQILEIKDERLSEISDGQRQKAMIARALAQDAPIMILDEPTAHLDLVNRFEIMQLLHSISQYQNKSILVITHDLDIALETSDQLWIMKKEEKLIAGLTEDLIVKGLIDSLFSKEKIHFNSKRGKVELENKLAKLDFEGDESLAFWIQKALGKANISEVKSPVKIYENPFFIHYEDLEFSSIQEFVAFLFLGE